MIHILRHFRVQDNTKQWLNSEEFNAWVQEYDTLTLECFDINLPRNIEKVYVSSQTRAIRTANFLGLKYEISDLLVEVGMEACIDTKVRFPKWLWLLAGRILWYFNVTSHENRDITDKRINEFIENIDLDDDILIVTHGFFIKQIVRKFKILGFFGNIDIRPKNAKIYELQKAS